MKLKKKSSFLPGFSIGILLLILIFACSKNSEQPQDVKYPDKDISYSIYIQPIFSRECALSGCHNSANPAAGLNLEQPLDPNFPDSEGQPMVYPNAADNSPLYRVLLGPYQGIPQMPPPPAAPLTDAEIAAIKLWINEGAILTN